MSEWMHLIKAVSNNGGRVLILNTPAKKVIKRRAKIRKEMQEWGNLARSSAKKK